MAIITAQAPLPVSEPKESTKLGQVSTSNEAPAQEVAKEVKDEAMSPKFAALARKEKALRAQAQAIKAREDALKAQEADYASKYVPKDKVKENPLAVLSELGLSYEDLTQLILNGPKAEDPALAELRNELKAIKESQTQTQTKFEEQQKAQYEQAVAQIRNETKMLIASDASYEMIKDTGNEEAVVELIKETFDSEGKLLSIEEAAKQVEEYLFEEAVKLAQLNKVKKKLMPEPETVQAPMKQTDSKQQQLKTLTNAASATTPRGLTAKERRERAILAFQGKLT